MQDSWLADHIGARIEQIHLPRGDCSDGIGPGQDLMPTHGAGVGVERVKVGGSGIIAGAGEQGAEGGDVERALVQARLGWSYAFKLGVPEEGAILGTPGLDGAGGGR